MAGHGGGLEASVRKRGRGWPILKSLAGHEPELDGGDGAAAVAVEEGEDLAILLDLVLGQEDVDVLRLHLQNKFPAAS